MDSTSLTKPVDLQGLSLALAKTKADYEAQINQVAVQSDWEMDDEGSVAYILNKPAIRAGEGENSIIEGNFDEHYQSAIYILNITGGTGVTTFSYTSSDSISLSSGQIYPAYCEWSNGERTYYTGTIVTGVDTTNHTVTLIEPVSKSSPVASGILSIYKNCRIAKGNHSHAEGDGLTVGVRSHAEGAGNAISTDSHAEGSGWSMGISAHAEGDQTKAIGAYSHSEGYRTIAHYQQHVQGKYNIEDSNSTYAHIVGNGDYNAPSNAHTLDWNGNAWYAGKVSAGTVANPANPTADNDLVTKAYVDANAGGSSTLVDLIDTTITTPADGQILKYDGTNQSWINSEFPQDVFLITATATYNSAAPDLFDYTFDKTYNEITAAYNAGKICLVKYNSHYYYYESVNESNILFLSFQKTPYYDNYYIHTFVITSSNNVSHYDFEVPQELDDLERVSIQSPYSGQSLIYSSGGNWKNGYIELTQLSDTTISSPTNGQVLTYDSTTSKWINSNTLTETRVNELIAAALAQYGDGDTASYGYTDASEVNY